MLTGAPRPRGPTFHIHYRFTLPTGEVVVARVHGDGGVISSTNGTRGLRRLKIAQQRALDGKSTGIAEPRPGHIRALVTYDVRGQTEQHIDIRTCTVEIASDLEAKEYIARSRAYWWPNESQPLGRIPVAAESALMFVGGAPT
jgi:hypothetical protein